jgi:hypothetical protein
MVIALMSCASPEIPGKRLAETLAVPSSNYPLAGFWKEQASNS